MASGIATPTTGFSTIGSPYIPYTSAIPAGTHTPPFRINSPPAVISVSSSSPLPEAETMVKQAERLDEETQLKGEEPFTQPDLTLPPPAHVVSTKGNQPAPTEQIGCASCGTCDTAT